MTWLSGEVFVAVTDVKFQLTKETQTFLALTWCKQISVVFLNFHFVAKIVKSRQKKYISCCLAVSINIVLNVTSVLSCCSSGALP